MNAMKKIDRAVFVPEELEANAYYDIALPIGYGQTISQPSVIAHMLTKLEIKKGDNILEIGTGSGYQTAILCELVGEEGNIVSVDRIHELIERARFNIHRYGYSPVLRTGDASCGWKEFMPYDGIIASAAYPGPGLPDEVKRQLKHDGIFVGPVGRILQGLAVYYRSRDEIVWDIPVMFVPMIGRCAHKEV